LLADALRRGRHAQLYFNGLNLAPHDLAGRTRRGLTLPPDLTLLVSKVRALHFAQAVFWFEATFTSDQKEQEIVPLGMDLHYNREVRHLEQLLSESNLSEIPSIFLPEARRASVAEGYRLAREGVLKTLGPMINTRQRRLRDYVEQQIARMVRYYADLRREIEEQMRRAADRDEGGSKFTARLDGLVREERVRVAELRQKSQLRVGLRLLNLLLIQQPKLLVRCLVKSLKKEMGRLELVWDPLTEALEALPCPECSRPTLALAVNRQSQLVCPACAAKPAGPERHPHW
jgi:hypothetical protein